MARQRTADSDVARKRDPAPLRDPSKQTLYNSIGLSLTNHICTLAFGIVLAICFYSGSGPVVCIPAHDENWLDFGARVTRAAG